MMTNATKFFLVMLLINLCELVFFTSTLGVGAWTYFGTLGALCAVAGLVIQKFKP